MAFLRFSTIIFLVFVPSLAFESDLPHLFPERSPPSTTLHQTTNGSHQSDGWEWEKEARNIYQSWAAMHGKSYTVLAEGDRRFNIFKDNLKYIQEHNKNPDSPYKLGLTVFADLTHEEYVKRHVGKVSVPPFRRIAAARKLIGGRNTAATDEDDDGLPEKVDWREKNAVTPVKNQMGCGSCWAFATVAAVEGIYAIESGELVSFSEQQVIDCVTEKQGGCKAGVVDYALVTLSEQRLALHTLHDYPYVARQGECDLSNKPNKTTATITGLVNVPQSDELAMKRAVAQQPCTATFDVSSKVFQLYQSGVITGKCGHNINHVAVIIGYGTENGVDYWLLKNSWGPKWGENGYFRVRRNVPWEKYGKCGVATDVSYPLMED